MYIDNFGNPQNGFQTPSTGFASPATGFQTPAAQSPFAAPQAAPAPVAPAPAPAIPVERPEGFIEGWDEFEEGWDFSQNAVNIKVFGVGGGGNNAVNRMFLDKEKTAEMVVVNTDLPVLRSSPVKRKVAIGRNTTRGHGAGSNPERGCAAAEESIEVIRRMLEGTDMLYITAGMGGGTGTGASPVIARVARDMGILTIAVVTKPFEFEGPARMAQAEDGINKLRQCCDAVIVVPNQKLLTLSDKPLQTKEAFRAADEILIKSVQCICRIINDESYINLDFADVLTTLRNAGDAHIGIGVAEGPNKAMTAAELAINSPLLETSINEADGMIISVVANDDVPINEINDAAKRIGEEASKNARIIWGLKLDPNMGDKIEITVIATRSGGISETAAPVAPNPIELPLVNAVPVAPVAPATPVAPVAEPVAPAPETPAPAVNPNPIAVKPETPAPAPTPSNSSFYTDLDWKFLQGVAMRKPTDENK